MLQLTFFVFFQPFNQTFPTCFPVSEHIYTISGVPDFGPKCNFFRLFFSTFWFGILKSDLKRSRIFFPIWSQTAKLAHFLPNSAISIIPSAFICSFALFFTEILIKKTKLILFVNRFGIHLSSMQMSYLQQRFYELNCRYIWLNYLHCIHYYTRCINFSVRFKTQVPNYRQVIQ